MQTVFALLITGFVTEAGFLKASRWGSPGILNSKFTENFSSNNSNYFLGCQKQI